MIFSIIFLLLACDRSSPPAGPSEYVAADCSTAAYIVYNKAGQKQYRILLLYTIAKFNASFSQVYKNVQNQRFNVDFGFNDVYNLNNSYQIICICLTVIDFVALFLKVR